MVGNKRPSLKRVREQPSSSSARLFSALFRRSAAAAFSSATACATAAREADGDAACAVSAEDYVIACSGSQLSDEGAGNLAAQDSCIVGYSGLILIRFSSGHSGSLLCGLGGTAYRAPAPKFQAAGAVRLLLPCSVSFCVTAQPLVHLLFGRLAPQFVAQSAAHVIALGFRRLSQ